MFLLGGVLSQRRTDSPDCALNNEKTVEDCCKMPYLVKAELHEYCRTANPGNPNVVKTDGCCVARCILTTTEVFKNNTIDSEFARVFFNVTVGSDSQFSGPLIDAIIEDCAEQINADDELEVPPLSASTGVEGCSMRPELFFNCVALQMFQQCPSSVWTDDPGCDALMVKAKSGACFYESLAG
ncbi:general odorant-binding protein 67-like [Uranotaenia lowii]|uniref:general odorant-binding protein 67-like n=1 Tax=Uranotaenia lowii TaxID=190385 RepID=UPI00247A6874|nr:general odorant-binding protein 67-like [Uranotaenia lowii]